MRRIWKAQSVPQNLWTPERIELYEKLIEDLCRLWDEVPGATWEWLPEYREDPA